MKRRAILATVSTLLAIVTAVSLAQNPGRPGAQDITFARDVAPILYEHCVFCHRPGQAAPFSLLTYSDARPWARSIRQQILLRRMPPWFLSSHDGSFRNVKPLSEQESAILVAWVDSGARDGGLRDMPQTPRFGSGWEIGTPDLIVRMTESYKIPATGTIPEVTLPTNYEFREDTWLQAIEVRPGNRRAVHQALAMMGSSGLATGLHFYAPGLPAMAFREGYGRFIPRGTRIHLRMHYTATGQDAVDLSEVGFKFATKPVHTEVRTGIADANVTTPSPLASHDFTTTFPLPQNARIHAFRPHMSVRGTNATATLVSPDRSRQILLSVAGWTDDWAYSYILTKPRDVPQGSAVEYATNVPIDPKSGVNTHLLSFDWTPVNPGNKDDAESIYLPANPLFTTGVQTP